MSASTQGGRTVCGHSFDQVYGGRSGLVFGTKPTKVLDSYLSDSSTTGSALDLGCGEGRDTIPLLKRGFSVTALDIAQAAIAKLLSRRDLTPEMKSALTTVVADVRYYDWPTEKYDWVLAVTLLDHLEIEHIPSISRNMIRATREGGLVFVEVHTDRDPGVTGEGPMSEFSSHIKHYFATNELLGLFAPDLRILAYEDRLEWDYDHGEPHKHGFASLLGQRQENKRPISADTK